jgi:hypothetical protein
LLPSTVLTVSGSKGPPDKSGVLSQRLPCVPVLNYDLSPPSTVCDMRFP